MVNGYIPYMKTVPCRRDWNLSLTCNGGSKGQGTIKSVS